MSDNHGHWTLGIQINRKIGETTYTSLRLYVPKNDEKLLLKRLQAEGGDRAKLYFDAKFHGAKIVLTPVQHQAEAPTPTPSLSLAERADQVIAIIVQQGGTTTWPTVREKLGLPPESTPSPFLVKQLIDRGLQTTKNPKTSTMTWKLIDRSTLNGWTCTQE
jgi:hypothetical protein